MWGGRHDSEGAIERREERSAGVSKAWDINGGYRQPDDESWRDKAPGVTRELERVKGEDEGTVTLRAAEKPEHEAAAFNKPMVRTINTNT